MADQRTMYYHEMHKLSETYQLFSDMVKRGDIDRATLVKLIERRPELWGRFRNWLNVLK